MFDKVQWLGQKWPHRIGNIVIIAFVVTHLADAILTYLGISTDIAYEKNQIAAYTFELVGLGPGLLLFKFACIVCGLILFYFKLHLFILLSTLLGIIFAVIPGILILNGIDSNPLTW